MEQEYVLSVKVNNNNGVLLRVSGLFSRRCFNIKSLNVAETETPEISRMTIVVNADQRSIEQIKKTDNMERMRIYDRILEKCFPVEVKGVSRRRRKVIDSYKSMKEILGI